MVELGACHRKIGINSVKRSSKRRYRASCSRRSLPPSMAKLGIVIFIAAVILLDQIKNDVHSYVGLVRIRISQLIWPINRSA